jgi:thioredoxin 1
MPWLERNFGTVFEQNKTNKFNPMALEITDSNFQETVLQSSQPVLVDFWAEWCGPCRMVGPVVEEISREMEGKAVVGKLDVDSNPEVATRYGIRSIPTLLVFKNGEVVEKQVGVVPKQNLVAMLNAHMA